MNDYISRKSILEELDKTIHIFKEKPPTDTDKIASDVCSAISVYIKNMQQAKVHPVRCGKWLQNSKTHMRCSSCKQFLVPILKSRMYDYCPHCGAKMEGDTMNDNVMKPVIYTFTVYYKFNDDTRVNTVDHTIISNEDYEQAAQECMHYFEDVLDEFDAVPVGLVLKGSDPLAD